MVPENSNTDKLYSDIQFEKRTSSCFNNKIYCGNQQDLGIVIALWIVYFLLSLYFLVVISPYFWVDYSPAITIIGIFLSIPGIYNAIKCFFTDPGILKKNTYIKQEQNDIEENKKENVDKEMKSSVENLEKEPASVENTLVTQKIKIIDKQQHFEQKENGEVNAQNLIEPKIQMKIVSPLKNLEINSNEKMKYTDDQVESLQKKELLQINNEIQNINNDQQFQQNGLQNFENQGFVKEEIQPNQTQPLFFNPFPIKPFKPQHNVQNKFKGGNLFEERYCETCKLKRPPLASHCYFMGNCIGERNHKNFFLFLWLTFIWALYCFVFSIISFSDNIGRNRFVFVQFYEEIYIFYIFIAFVSYLLLSVICKLHERTIKLIVIPTILVVLISYFWIATYSGIEYYTNPVIPLLGILIYAFSILSLLNFAFSNCYLVCIGSTLKQETYKSKHNLDNESTSLKQKCINFVKFLTYQPSKSEILNGL